VASVALAACGDDSGSSAASTAAPAQAQSQTGLAGTSWILSSFTTSSGSSVDAVTTAPAALAFTEDKVTGSTGCNDFSGTYTSDEEALTITLGPMTQKACTDAALTAQETAVTAQLAKVASYTSDDTGLTLKDSSGAVVFQSATFPGVATRDFPVPALKAGTYPFVCTVPPTMTATLTAQ